MAIKNLIFLAGAAMAHTIFSRDTKFGCAAPEPTKEHLQISREFALQEAQALANGDFVTMAGIDVNVYLHTVSVAEGTLLSEAKLKEQFDVLAKDYSPYGINLKLAGTTKTVDASWGKNGDEMAMKKKLRKGTYKDLNIYFQDEVEAGGVLGYCYFPEAVTEGSEKYIRDGCQVIASSVPGGTAPFDLGKTAVHEAGHWFGLYHTFQDGCSASGDGVADTPSSASPSSGCPKNRDSCPNQPGLDPIHNYMDYSDDSCYEEFTKGQVARIQSFWEKFRANK